MQKKTEFGRELLHQSWIAYEFTTMQTLHAAGADVPEPYAMAHNAILMDYIGDPGVSAPTLNEVSLDRTEAGRLFDRTIRNIDMFLANERIHGDLSAYNILYWEGEIILIDFPQVVSPGSNRHAYEIFERDVMRVCEYFSVQGIRADAGRLAMDLWASRGFRLPSKESHPA
jgi:RIO kinase 1